MSQKLHALGTALFAVSIFTVMLSDQWARAYRAIGETGDLATVAPKGNFAFVAVIQVSFLLSLFALLTAEFCRYREARASNAVYRFLGE